MREVLSFDDVLLELKFSNISSLKEIDVKTKLTKNISLNIPIISANKENITESEMAICMAEMGGIGIIHRFSNIEKQVKEVVRVKRAHNFIIQDPYTINLDSTVIEVIETMKNKSVNSLLVIDDNKKIKGIVTQRDLLFQEDEIPLSQIMTTLEKIIYRVAKNYSDVDFEEAKKIMMKSKIEKLPIIDSDGYIKGLITAKDMKKRKDFPNALKDEKGRLRVGADIGITGDYFERAIELVKSDVDFLLIDTSHGHSQDVLDVIYKIKSEIPKIDIVAGNVSTKHGTLDLIKAGADGIKCGFGNNIINKNLVLPQITAIMDCCDIATYEDVPIISDGGIKKSGDIVKALSAGASAIMLDDIFENCEEIPQRNNDDYEDISAFSISQKDNSRDISSIIKNKGKTKNILDFLLKNLKLSMNYLGVSSIEDMQKNSDFLKRNF
ncbi:MAG: IMP dehydrogenase [Cyanobacteriota bacterium]